MADAETARAGQPASSRCQRARAAERVARLVPAHEPELRALATDLLVDVWHGRRAALPGHPDLAAACVDAAVRILAARWHRDAQRTPGLRSCDVANHT